MCTFVELHKQCLFLRSGPHVACSIIPHHFVLLRLVEKFTVRCLSVNFIMFINFMHGSTDIIT